MIFVCLNGLTSIACSHFSKKNPFLFCVRDLFPALRARTLQGPASPLLPSMERLAEVIDEYAGGYGPEDAVHPLGPIKRLQGGSRCNVKSRGMMGGRSFICRTSSSSSFASFISSAAERRVWRASRSSLCPMVGTKEQEWSVLHRVVGRAGCKGAL